MSKRNETYFNENLFKDSRFSSWIEKGQQNTSTKYKVCCKVIDLSSMGVSSLVSHASGKKHIKAMSSSNSSLTLEFFSEPPQKVVGPEEKKVHQSAPGSKKLDQYVQLHQVISAEILWTLKVVMSKCHYVLANS